MLIAGNWKMYKTAREATAFAGEIRSLANEVDPVRVVVCPPFTSLRDAAVALRDTAIDVYAQNGHWADEGAFTGEVSVPMLRELGAVGTIVGHSERRQHFGETDESVGRRAAHALSAGLHVIACVGELESERERGETEDVLRRQLAFLRAHERLVVAYEPVWAIGTGRTAKPEQAQEAHAFIKSLLDVPVLYGGSVKSDNAETILREPDVDGALVGGASLEASSFRAICEAAASAARG